MWEEITKVFISEFSDLPQFTDALRVIIRLVVAAFLSGLIGYERELQEKSAGIRTHMLVGLGTALFVIIPLQGGASMNDMTRVVQGIVQGAGFLGAGAIIVGTATNKTKGLTTAASTWACAGIGAASGLGMETTAILSTIIILAILAVVPHILSIKRKKLKK